MLRDSGLHDHSGGCVRKLSLTCGASSTKSSFSMNSRVTLPEHSQTVAAASAAECNSICLSDCSCNAYAYDSSSCLIWKDELLNLKQLSLEDGGGSVIYTRLYTSYEALGEGLTIEFLSPVFQYAGVQRSPACLTGRLYK